MNTLKMMPQLIRASLEHDDKSIEVISLTISNSIRNKYPSIADEIDKILFDRNIGNDAYRSIGLNDIPIDKNNMNLVSIKEPTKIKKPIYTEEVSSVISNFLKEQDKKFELIKSGIKPSNSILLYGEPGVGKTYTAQWIASVMKKPLVSLDLATVMSSYLGETGTNVKKVLDYSKKNDCILFLDEFDAIAKTRTDDRELGEIKRIVNVLLKELEEWPIGSIIIAATNHDELLDKAIWRRFDLKIQMNVPNKVIRYKIIEQEFECSNNLTKDIKNILSEVLKDENGAEIVRTCNEIKKINILEGIEINKVALMKACEHINKLEKDKKINIIKYLIDQKIDIKEISKYTNISISTIYRYIKK